LGDIEADLILGFKARGYILTLVDRVSRRTILKKLKTKTKTEVYFAICYALEDFKILRTLTVDNGKEFALHQQIAKQKKVKVYFTHPYTSQEKGTVENTNGLIRYYFPKGTDLSKVSSKKIKSIENRLNNQPRKILNYLTPNEYHHKKLKEERRL
jgi:IS30 family transposase